MCSGLYTLCHCPFWPLTINVADGCQMKLLDLKRLFLICQTSVLIELKTESLVFKHKSND